MTSLDFIQPFWTAAQASVKARRTDATIAPIPPSGGIPVCIVAESGCESCETETVVNMANPAHLMALVSGVCYAI